MKRPRHLIGPPSDAIASRFRMLRGTEARKGNGWPFRLLVDSVFHDLKEQRNDYTEHVKRWVEIILVEAVAGR